MTSMTTTPTAIGSGAIGAQVGLDVGVGVGQQLPGRVPVVPGQRQLQVLPGDPRGGTGLQPVLHDPGEEAAAGHADRLEQRPRRR